MQHKPTCLTLTSSSCNSTLLHLPSLCAPNSKSAVYIEYQNYAKYTEPYFSRSELGRSAEGSCRASPARLLSHDVFIRRIEAQGSGWQAISHQVDPQQLHWVQRLWHAQQGCKEDRNHLANVGGHHVADELHRTCAHVSQAADVCGGLDRTFFLEHISTGRVCILYFVCWYSLNASNIHPKNCTPLWA